MSQANDATNLESLHAAVKRAQCEEQRPFEPGEETRPIRVSEGYFEDADWLNLDRVIRQIAAEGPETFSNFFGPMQAKSMVIRELEETTDSPTLQALIDSLQERVADFGPWIATTPIANLELPPETGWIDIDGTTALVAANADKSDERWSTDDNHHFSIIRKFGDGSGPRPRWLNLPSLDESIDTRHSAALISLQTGPDLIAEHRAEVEATYAVSVWCVNLPPTTRQLSPVVTEWVPQPWIHTRPRLTPAKRNHGATDRERSGQIRTYPMWQPPTNASELQLPFRALQLAQVRHSARALLSSSRSFRQTCDPGNEMLVAERILHLGCALESLCEPADHGNGTIKRWNRLIANLGLRTEMEKDNWLTAEEFKEASDALYAVRNIAAHAADAVLANIGYPADHSRKVGSDLRPGTEIALSRLHLHMHPMRWILGQALQRCWQAASEDDFDDAKFETRLFQA